MEGKRIGSALSCIRTTISAGDIENGDPRQLDLDPSTFTLGLGYRF